MMLLLFAGWQAAGNDSGFGIKRGRVMSNCRQVLDKVMAIREREVEEERLVRSASGLLAGAGQFSITWDLHARLQTGFHCRTLRSYSRAEAQFLLLLVAIACYSYSQIRFLSLPISQALALLTLVLPIIAGVSTQGVHVLVQRSSRNKPFQLTVPLVAIVGFQLIYETIIATLALTYIAPQNTLKCHMDSRWQELYANKNENAVKAIQDSFNCCGFKTVTDRAYPFLNQVASSCAVHYKRNQSCFSAWSKAEQENAGLLLLVALLVFVTKATSLYALTGSSWRNSRWARQFKRFTNGAHRDEENRVSTRGLLEEGPSREEPYHDNPDDSTPVLAAVNGNHGRGPRLEPSQLADAHNEWREEGQAHRDT
ncbi:hypothetical protein G7Y89_g7022 [Cudoniella acicularis]|uniref:Tetraspanin Tsp3 n=1 Tax=Cudoniella acicularis TaxID=354080 RepID=A0A8H4RL69_9HELO|nr:hypothetical protein G7Y89_g7022 [Cudoniella acicularis]